VVLIVVNTDDDDDGDVSARDSGADVLSAVPNPSTIHIPLEHFDHV
jgi:hypothetical protein